MGRFTRYTDEDIVRAIRLLTANTGRKLVHRDFVQEHGTRFKTLSWALLKARYGNFTNSLIHAGVNDVPYWRPQGESREGLTFLHPLECLIDEMLHTEGLEHKHWVLTGDWIDAHPLIFPVIYEDKLGHKVGLLFRPDSTVADEFVDITRAARAWLARKMNGKVSVIGLPNLLYSLKEEIASGELGE